MKESLLPTDANMRQKYNRGRRAKSECKNLHYQKTKIQGVGRRHGFFDEYYLLHELLMHFKY